MDPKDYRGKGQRLNDYFGQNMSDGDRFGEIIPSMFNWMPPDELRQKVEELEDISRELSQAYRAQGKGGNKRNG